MFIIYQYLRDQTDMLVVGVIGLQGTGKSTIMSLLSANSPEEDQRLVHHQHPEFSICFHKFICLYTSLFWHFTQGFSVKQGVCVQSSDAGDQGESREPEQWNRFLHHSGEGHFSGHAGQTGGLHRTVLFSCSFLIN